MSDVPTLRQLADNQRSLVAKLQADRTEPQYMAIAIDKLSTLERLVNEVPQR